MLILQFEFKNLNQFIHKKFKYYHDDMQKDQGWIVRDFEWHWIAETKHA